MKRRDGFVQIVKSNSKNGAHTQEGQLYHNRGRGRTKKDQLTITIEVR